MKLKMLLGLMMFGLVFTACPSGDDDDSAAGDDDDATAGDDDDATGGFTAGQFQFTTVGVTDACTDGALEAIYLPGGAGTTSDWAYPIELPAFEDCPAQVSIQLQEPFNDMDVTIDTPGADQFSIAGEENLGVDLDPDTYADCVVDYTIDALIALQDNDNLSGSVTMHTGNWLGDDCPVVNSDPCDIVLDITATRL